MRNICPVSFRWLSFGLVMLVSVLSLAACGDKTSAPVPTATVLSVSPASTGPVASLTTKAAVGNLAPDFNQTGIDGKPVHLSALRGKAVVLNYWAIY